MRPCPIPNRCRSKSVPLADNEVLIEYALGEEAGYIFVVRQDGVHICILCLWAGKPWKPESGS